MGFYGDLLRAMEQARNERELQPFLKAHPILIQQAFNAWAWNTVLTIPEFQLGADYRIDFLVVGGSSAGWHLSIVELKSHRNPPFSQTGNHSAELATAIRQLKERAAWITENRPIFRQALSATFTENRIGAQCTNTDKHKWAATEIMDVDVPLRFYYNVVMGRRSMVPAEHQKFKEDPSIDRLRIVSYDRIVDVASKLDSAAGDIGGNGPT